MKPQSCLELLRFCLGLLRVAGVCSGWWYCLSCSEALMLFIIVELFLTMQPRATLNHPKQPQANPEQPRANPALGLIEVNSGLNPERPLGFNLTPDYGVYQVLDPYKSRMRAFEDITISHYKYSCFGSN